MSRWLAIIFLVACLQGCAPLHYVTIKADTVTLYLQAPQAMRVQFASSADHYTRHEAIRDRNGSWSVNGPKNQEFQYFYLIDGQFFIPDCRFRQSDDFGTTNCRHLP